MEHRVAVLEDDADTREMYVELLQAHGYAVVPASTGAELLAKLRTTDTPEAIVMDLGLPDTEGVSLCRVIRAHERFRRVPIFAVTGWSSGRYVQGLGDAAFNEVFLKPVAPVVLLDGIRRWAHAARSVETGKSALTS